MTSNSQYTVDLHTHSIISYDGGISLQAYTRALTTGLVDYIAVTDHNQTKFAAQLQKQLGDQIIIGEEIGTKDGEMIGLFLTDTIPSGLPAMDTARLIHRQNGIVYIPHPFETVRKGLQKETLEKIIKEVDVIEVFNGRAILHDNSQKAYSFTQQFRRAMASSSDAHSFAGLGTALSVVSGKPSQKNLVLLLQSAQFRKQYPPLYSLLSPTINKIRNIIFSQHGHLD
jgi:predicted metal-dependent phosphoesterase TrpH